MSAIDDPRLQWVMDRVQRTLCGVTEVSINALLSDRESVNTLIGMFENEDRGVEPVVAIIAKENDYVDTNNNTVPVSSSVISTLSSRSTIPLSISHSKTGNVKLRSTEKLNQRLHVLTGAVTNTNITESTHKPADRTRCMFFTRVDGSTITAEMAAN